MSLPALNGETLRSTRAGAGHLEVKLVSGHSTVTSVFARSPLRLLTPRPRGPSVWAYLSNFGGGLVAGDETQLAVDIGEHARCFITTQASTKVYRNPGGRPCGHVLEASLVEACAGARSGAGLCRRQLQAVTKVPFGTRQWPCPGGLLLLRPPGARGALGLHPF